jgi:hypothetical protein
LLRAVCRIREDDDVSGSDDRPPRGELAGVDHDDLSNRPALDLRDVLHGGDLETSATKDGLQAVSTMRIGSNQEYLRLCGRTHSIRYE